MGCGSVERQGIARIAARDRFATDDGYDDQRTALEHAGIDRVDSLPGARKR
ncbi:hypothetical protein [Phenylobacterium sp.]|uniref:hypothetical protein n=1 Tax=Phenylobacterium sp. TaxID=1871053 RepID=UPI0025E5C2AC|nr:hypothetical protein [Phenylobacterium sp.]